MLDASLGPNPGLKCRAMVNQVSGASRTFVVVDDQSCVHGYYAMAAGAVSHPMATSGMQRTMPDSGPVLMVQEAREPPSGPVTTGWVIDASGTMPWLFADEATPFTANLLDAVGAQVLWAPTLWVLECTNVLQNAQQRRRIHVHRRAQNRVRTERPAGAPRPGGPRLRQSGSACGGARRERLRRGLSRARIAPVACAVQPRRPPDRGRRGARPPGAECGVRRASGRCGRESGREIGRMLTNFG